MLQNMDIRWKTERVDFEQGHFLGIGAENMDIRPHSENMLVFPLSRFNHQEGNFSCVKLVEHLIDCIGFAGTSRTGYKSVGCQALPVDQYLLMLFDSHVMYIAK